MAEKTSTPAPSWVPVPDPTQRTAEQLALAIAAQRELLQGQRELLEARLDANDRAMALHRESEQRDIEGVRELLETRLSGGDKAIELVRVESERLADLIRRVDDAFPGVVDEKVSALREEMHGLRREHEEKFLSIKQQFIERDERDVRSQRDSKVAVDAALQAAKEAVGENNKSSALSIAKSEASTDKRIDQMSLLIQTTAKASDEKIDDLKQRLTRIEGRGEGGTAQRGETHWQISAAIAFAGLIFTVIAFIIGKVMF